MIARKINGVDATTDDGYATWRVSISRPASRYDGPMAVDLQTLERVILAP